MNYLNLCISGLANMNFFTSHNWNNLAWVQMPWRGMRMCPLHSHTSKGCRGWTDHVMSILEHGMSTQVNRVQ